MRIFGFFIFFITASLSGLRAFFFKKTNRIIIVVVIFVGDIFEIFGIFVLGAKK
jgi:hypothetical protein